VKFSLEAPKSRLSNSPTHPRNLIAEHIGTFVFGRVGAGSAVATQSLVSPDSAASLVIAALANGLGLAVAVSATMGISGGSLNPAVTLGLLVAKKIPFRDVIPYILAELAGATLAGLALVASLPSSLGDTVHWGAPTLASTLSVAQGTLLESLMTVFLFAAVIGTAVDPRAPKIGGFGIGVALLTDVLLGGPFTGAAANPARAMGPMLAGMFLPGYWYIYWIGPVAGALLVGLLYRYSPENRS